MVSPSAFSTGTLPAAECDSIAARVSGRSIGMTTSSNGAPVAFSASQPRNDQEE